MELFPFVDDMTLYIGNLKKLKKNLLKYNKQIQQSCSFHYQHKKSVLFVYTCNEQLRKDSVRKQLNLYEYPKELNSQDKFNQGDKRCKQKIKKKCSV